MVAGGSCEGITDRSILRGITAGHMKIIEMFIRLFTSLEMQTFIRSTTSYSAHSETTHRLDFTFCKRVPIHMIHTYCTHTHNW